MRILISDLQSDLAALFAGTAKELFSLIHTKIGQIFNKWLSCLLAENRTEMIG